MSRTDVHRPYQVQTKDPYNRHRVYRFQCQPWAPAEESMTLIPVYNTCGCWMCVGQYARKLVRRQERVQWRAMRQDLLKMAHVHALRDLDTPVIRRRGAY